MLTHVCAAGAVAALALTGAPVTNQPAPAPHGTVASVILPQPIPSTAVGPFLTQQLCERDRMLRGLWPVTTPCFYYTPTSPWLGERGWYYARKW